MAPNLAASQHALIWDMISGQASTYPQIVKSLISRSADPVKAISAKLSAFRQHYCTTLIVVAALDP